MKTERLYITYWLTRDADPAEGTLAEHVDVWSSRPVRHAEGPGAIWLDRHGSISERLAVWPVGFAKTIGTYPSDARQCVRVGPESDTIENVERRLC